MTGRSFDTKAADLNHSPTKDHIHESEVEVHDINFLFSPGIKLLSCCTWPLLATPTPYPAMATGLTELGLLILRKSVYDAGSSPGFSCDITRICICIHVGTRLCAITPGETRPTRIYRADHAESS